MAQVETTADVAAQMPLGQGSWVGIEAADASGTPCRRDLALQRLSQETSGKSLSAAHRICLAACDSL